MFDYRHTWISQNRQSRMHRHTSSCRSILLIYVKSRQIGTLCFWEAPMKYFAIEIDSLRLLGNSETHHNSIQFQQMIKWLPILRVVRQPTGHHRLVPTTEVFIELAATIFIANFTARNYFHQNRMSLVAVATAELMACLQNQKLKADLHRQKLVCTFLRPIGVKRKHYRFSARRSLHSTWWSTNACL